MSRRHDVLRGHPRRADERLFRTEGEPDRGDGRPGSGPARRGRLRARVVDAVAAARGVLRAADPARVAEAPAHAVRARHDGQRRVGRVGRRGPRGHGRAAGRGRRGRLARGAAGRRRVAAAARGAAAARARLTRAGARAAARAHRRRAAAAARTAARALEPTQAHLIIFARFVYIVLGGPRCAGGLASASAPAQRPRLLLDVDLTFRVLECFVFAWPKLWRLLFCSRAFTVFVVSLGLFRFALDLTPREVPLREIVLANVPCFFRH